MTVEAPVEVAAPAAAPKQPAPTKVMDDVPASAQQVTEVEVKTPTPEEREALGALPVLQSAAESAFAAENFEEAAEKLSEALDLLSKAYGRRSPRCAEALLMYGRALFKLAQKSEQLKNAINDDGVASAEAATGKAETDKEVPAESVPSAEREEEAAGEEEESAEEDEGEEFDVEEESAERKEEAGDGEDEVKSDLQAAFEILDVARVILEKMEGDKAQKMLLDAHLLLGDVSLVGQNFTLAASDFSSALEVAMKTYPSTDRAIAYVHFKRANALEWDNARDQAVEEVEKAIEVLKLRAELLACDEVKVSHDKDAEIKEIQELIPELEAKIKELKEAPMFNTLTAEDSLAGTAADMVKSHKKDVAEFLAQRLSQSEAATNPGANSACSVKRKAEKLPEEGEEAKKMKEASSRED